MTKPLLTSTQWHESVCNKKGNNWEGNWREGGGYSKAERKPLTIIVYMFYQPFNDYEQWQMKKLFRNRA